MDYKQCHVCKPNRKIIIFLFFSLYLSFFFCCFFIGPESVRGLLTENIIVHLPKQILLSCIEWNHAAWKKSMKSFNVKWLTFLRRRWREWIDRPWVYRLDKSLNQNKCWSNLRVGRFIVAYAAILMINFVVISCDDQINLNYYFSLQ